MILSNHCGIENPEARLPWADVWLEFRLYGKTRRLAPCFVCLPHHQFDQDLERKVHEEEPSFGPFEPKPVPDGAWEYHIIATHDKAGVVVDVLMNADAVTKERAERACFWLLDQYHPRRGPWRLEWEPAEIGPVTPIGVVGTEH